MYQSETGAVTRRSRRQSRWSAPVTAQRRVELADQSDTGRRAGESGRGMVCTADTGWSGPDLSRPSQARGALSEHNVIWKTILKKKNPRIISF